VTGSSPFRWRRRVAIRDVDAWGVVWYGHYLGYCDEARAEVLRAFGLAPGSFPSRGYLAPVVEVTGRYYKPARFDEEVDVHVRVSNPRGTRLRFDFTIQRTDDAALLAQIATTQVLVRHNGDLVYLLPEELRTAVQHMLEAQQEHGSPAAARNRGHPDNCTSEGP
jgi:acyl-CoA thioester hydrolase